MPKLQRKAEFRRAVPVFDALGDAVRIQIVARLCARGPLSIARIAEGARISRQGMTKHLRVLEHAGLLSSSKSGREQIWQVETKALSEAQRCLGVIAGEWERVLSRLKVFVEDHS